MTNAEYLAYVARNHKVFGDNKRTDSGCYYESELHKQINDECSRRGWLVIHSRMDKKTTNGVGTPDFVIYGSQGSSEGTQYPVVFTVEAKSRTGKLRPEQAAMIAQAARFGHTIHVVRSFEEFLKLI